MGWAELLDRAASEGSFMVVLEQVRSRPRVLLVGAVLVLACGALGGCSELEPAIIRSSIVPADPRLDTEVQDWLENLPPEERAMIEKEIRSREDVLIHVLEGHLDENDSRGGASSLASSPFSQKRCKKHPRAKGVPWRRDWDVFIDRPLAEKWAKKNGIRGRADVTIHHEIRAHILLMLRNPDYIDFIIEKNKEVREGATKEVRKKAAEEIKKLKEYLEEEGRKTENEYRRHVDFEEVPEYLPEPAKP